MKTGQFKKDLDKARKATVEKRSSGSFRRLLKKEKQSDLRELQYRNKKMFDRK